MATRQILQCAGLTSTKTSPLTDAQSADILRWFTADKRGPDPEGLTQAQLNQWLLDQANEEIWRYIRQEARKNRLRELRDAANVDAQADADTAL